MPPKSAIVVSWPSVDAPAGKLLSEWETQVTQELCKWSGFRPSAIFAAHDQHLAKWPQAFTSGKPGTDLVPAVQASRQRLWDSLAGFDIALTLGPYAMYALTGETALDTYRGTHIDSPYVAGLQVVPTYAPEIYSRFSWHERPVIVSAMRKACQRYEDRDRTIYIPETVADLYWFSTQFLSKEFAFDVETNVAGRITEFSLAPDSTRCLYVQLEDRAKRSIWSAEDELDIWLWLHWLAQREDLSWGFHNATYDLTYLDAYGIRPRGHIFDTMLRHHAWHPELEKSLGFLASMHIPTRAWKHLRTKAKKDFNKAGAI